MGYMQGKDEYNSYREPGVQSTDDHFIQ